MKIVAVLGSAPCGLDDLAALKGMCQGEVSIAAVNRSIQHPLKFDYFITGHPDLFHSDVLNLRDAGRVFYAIGAVRHQGYDTHFAPRMQQGWGGTVANAICYFTSNGYRVVLCGCPFDSSGHFSDASLDYHSSELWDWFLRGHPHRAGHNVDVRSMSGQTRELFGYPTKEWLNG